MATTTYIRAPVATPAEAAARINDFITTYDTRSRKPLWGIPPEAANAPVLEALADESPDAEKMLLLAPVADTFRVHSASPLLLRFANKPHNSFQEYLARLAALQGSADTSPGPAPAEGYRLLVSLTAAEEASRALSQLLHAFVAYAPQHDMSPLAQRVPAIVVTLDEQGRVDDSARLEARNVEDFGLNDLPRAQAAVRIMDTIGATDPQSRLDALAAIHIGADLRFREFLLPFAVRNLQEEAIAGRAGGVAQAFLRAYSLAAAESDENTRRVRQAIAAQAAAWFGAELNEDIAQAAGAMTPEEAGIFGTLLEQKTQ